MTRVTFRGDFHHNALSTAIICHMLVIRLYSRIYSSSLSQFVYTTDSDHHYWYHFLKAYVVEAMALVLPAAAF